VASEGNSVETDSDSDSDLSGDGEWVSNLPSSFLFFILPFQYMFGRVPLPMPLKNLTGANLLLILLVRFCFYMIFPFPFPFILTVRLLVKFMELIIKLDNWLAVKMEGSSLASRIFTIIVSLLILIGLILDTSFGYGSLDATGLALASGPFVAWAPGIGLDTTNTTPFVYSIKSNIISKNYDRLLKRYQMYLQKI
jgi:hypothetical protein